MHNLSIKSIFRITSLIFLQISLCSFFMFGEWFVRKLHVLFVSNRRRVKKI